MDVEMTDNSRKRKNGTDCILCMECVKVCPKEALQGALSVLDSSYLHSAEENAIS